MTNEKAEKILFYHRSTGNLSPMLNEALDLAISALSKQSASSEQLDSAQPEIKTGRWIKPTGMMPPEHHGHYECSECGAWAMRSWLRPWKGVVLTDFCPACSIPMLKEGEG